VAVAAGSSREQLDGLAAPAPVASPPAPGPGLPLATQTVLALQRSAGNQAVTRALQRAAATTSGGEWDTDMYAPHDAGSLVGAQIDLKFTPKDPVIAKNIGLTQTVKTMKSTAAGGAVDTADPSSDRNQSLALPPGSSDPGRAIDQGEGNRRMPNTNPLYAVDNEPGSASTALGDTPPSPNMGSHASRTENPGDGAFEEMPGHLRDGPRRPIEFPGQQYRQTFEAAALAIDGPLANMYLGSVEWGWKVDADHKVALDPEPIKVVREGSPSAAFMAAAQRWNEATFTDSRGNVHNTVDLPIAGVDAGALNTPDLYTRLVDTRRQAETLDGPAKVCKEFEAHTLERELKRRKVKVAVKVNKTEDITGADDVYVKLSGPKVHQTVARRMNDGDREDFVVTLGDLGETMPLVDPVAIEVFDEDLVDADDLIVTLSWPAPYGPARSAGSLDGANYEVSVSYER
jgi:hypothetical protein